MTTDRDWDLIRSDAARLEQKRAQARAYWAAHRDELNERRLASKPKPEVKPRPAPEPAPEKSRRHVRPNKRRQGPTPEQIEAARKWREIF